MKILMPVQNYHNSLTTIKDHIMSEKRKHIRRFAAMNISCYSADGSVPIEKCLLVNISKGGIALESKKNYPKGENLLLSFYSPDGRDVSVRAEILRSSSGGFGKLYGAKFNEPDLKKVSELNHYLLKYFNLY